MPHVQGPAQDAEVRADEEDLDETYSALLRQRLT